MKLDSTEKNRFELAVCKMKARWHANDNSDLFATDDQGEYLNPEIKNMSDGWALSSGNITLSSFVEGRNDLVTNLLSKIIDANLIPADLATKINIAKFQNEQYFDDMDYVSDAYCALFSHEDHLVNAIDHIIKTAKKDKENA